MEFIYSDLGYLYGGEIVEVTLDKAANVCLLDSNNFYKYKSGYDFNYRGEISSSIRDGKWTRQETQTKLENIITDTGKKYYQITFSEYVICTEEKDKEGISILTLHDENNKLLCRICYM